MARTEDFWQTGIGETYIETIAPNGYDILIKGVNKYLNFGSIVGSLGYGIRDNNGVIEFKNSAGTWAPAPGSNLTVDSIQFNTAATPLPNTEGLLQWNPTDGTLDLGMQGGAITQQIGQELFVKVRNASGATIQNGSSVYFSGRQGNRPKIDLALGDADTTSCVMGLVTEDILDNSDGYLTTFGYVRGIKTDYVGWTEGAKLWQSTTVPGGLTVIEPSAPSHSDVVGFVGIVHANQGSIFVTINRHRTVTELSDVNGTPLTTAGQIMVWDEARKVFDFDKNINDYATECKAIAYAIVL